MLRNCARFVVSVERSAARLYVRFHNMLAQDNGIETIEWVALAAVVIVLIGGIMAIFSGQGQKLGQAIFDGIMSWVAKLMTK